VLREGGEVLPPSRRMLLVLRQALAAFFKKQDAPASEKSPKPSHDFHEFSRESLLSSIACIGCTHV
jgi:hypothetical protein